MIEETRESHILVVDDDPMLCRQLELYLRKLGRDCQTAHTLAKGMDLAQKQDIDVVFLDVNLPDSSGLDGIDLFKVTSGAPEVIIITSDSDPDGAELAVRNGAWYYLEKPLSYNTIKLMLGRVLQFREHSRHSSQQYLMQRTGIVGQDPRLMACLNNVAVAARSSGNVLITGETGTGKELAARAIHENSSRAKRPFVVLDCPNIPEKLAESILFGHEKGAFTDARERREGLVSQADGGTLFLDEVGDLPLELQRSLLRVIQEKRFRTLGGAQEYSIDVRFVAATNRNIAAMVEEEQFRMDLFYRLATFHIAMPPLRKRSSDIKLLVRHFLDEICLEEGVAYKGVSSDFMEAFTAYEWPGNVRELSNVLRRSVAAAGSEPVLYPHHLPTEFKAVYFRSTISSGSHTAPPSHQREDPAHQLEQVPFSHDAEAGSPNQSHDDNQALPPLKEFRDTQYKQLEAEYLDRLISTAGGAVPRACAVAGISRSRLYQLLEKHGRKMN